MLSRLLNQMTSASTGSVGRNRKNAMTICVIGSSSRGNAVLRMSLPPPTTDPADCETPLWKNV